MDVATRMNRLYAQWEGCLALVLGDAGTGTVLRACAGPGERQEDHDALLAEGARLLGPGPAALLARALMPPGIPAGEQGAAPARPSFAMVEDARGLRLFARAGREAPELVCARVAPDLAASDLHGFQGQLTAFAGQAADG